MERNKSNLITPADKRQTCDLPDIQQTEYRFSTVRGLKERLEI